MRHRLVWLIAAIMVVAACGGDADPGTTQPEATTTTADGGATTTEPTPTTTEPAPTTTEPEPTTTTQPEVEASLEEIAAYIDDNSDEDWGLAVGASFSESGEEQTGGAFQGVFNFAVCFAILPLGDVVDDELLFALWQHPTGNGGIHIRMLVNPPSGALEDIEAFADAECESYDNPNVGAGDWTMSTETIAGVDGLHYVTRGQSDHIDRGRGQFFAIHRNVLLQAVVDIWALDGEPLEDDVNGLIQELAELAIAALDQ